jgi:hydroxymethylbilane synthase
LLHLRPDLEVVAVRGNVETRLDQAVRGRLDAVVLAEAGLRRLGLDRHVTERLAPPAFLPAVAQGALGLECRADDVALRALLAPLDDAASHRAVRAERRVLAELEGGCMIPLAAWAREAGGELALDVAAFDLDGRGRLAASAAGPREGPDDLGRRVARDLRALGAERLLRPLPSGGRESPLGKKDNDPTYGQEIRRSRPGKRGATHHPDSLCGGWRCACPPYKHRPVLGLMSGH